ncbi:MAG: cobaltochelatase subunit CobN [Treponema sp.]|jgi:cobaltochelatase CobN|nr:cobaltochelatase subunit CobN [Treponema sp.]
MAIKWDGIYGLRENESEDGYVSMAAEEKTKSGKPVIGIFVHYHYVEHKDTKHIDALIEACRRKGAIPLAFYSNVMPEGDYEGLNGAFQKFCRRGGETIIDTLLVTIGHSQTALGAPGSGAVGFNQSIFESLDVPVIQAMTTFFTEREWRESIAGMDMTLLTSNIYQPEFDGQIITTVIAAVEHIPVPEGVQDKYTPIADRVEKVVALAINWARLRQKKWSEKKAAIILHNMPPRADMIGCAYGLDTPASVWNMINAMREAGFRLDYDFKDGKEIIGKITSGLTNDTTFLSEQEILERGAAVINRDEWKRMFAGFPEKALRQLERDWGRAPGEFMTAEDKILLPGILNGNLFIGLQPPRAFEEKAEECYHSTDIVCPWQYLAFYRWIENSFGADVIIHAGTHGTLEWLPGKEKGLSEECFPDIAIGTLPHLYPYIIDVPGEGAQAKRRSAAVIIDHLIPSMRESGLYGDLLALDEGISAYRHAKENDPGKLHSAAALIWKRAAAQHFDRDLCLEEAAFIREPEPGIEKLHRLLERIKYSKIKDGLHIFGMVPKAERYDNLVTLLSELKKEDPALVRQKLDAVGDELKYFIRGMEGRFVPPGGSGAPSRGNINILPTGRNFYMIDPQAIPSRAAWETGGILAQQLLERGIADTGSLPETAAIVVYAGETIKTCGDDIAEILRLYGVRPVWAGGTNHVSGIEVIPLEELKRPRIDVVARISGLFRDMFPNLSNMIDDAVNMIANLDESPEENFVKKHILADIEKLASQGHGENEARELAGLRVFGCPPGNYGAGVDIMINSRKWESNADLAKVYVNWSAHGYSKKIHGEKLPDLFMRRLESCTVTVKNISSWESDMLDDDDYYNYHGGLISAVKAASGKTPASYSTNCADPERPATSSIQEDAARIMRARINNPLWVKGLKAHGFRGAQEFSAMVDFVFGWDAAAGIIEDWMYDSIAGTYLLDKDLRGWIRQNNPYALRAMSERLLEAAQRGMWNAGEETLEELRKIYLETEGDLEGRQSI